MKIIKNVKAYVSDYMDCRQFYEGQGWDNGHIKQIKSCIKEAKESLNELFKYKQYKSALQQLEGAFYSSFQNKNLPSSRKIILEHGYRFNDIDNTSDPTAAISDVIQSAMDAGEETKFILFGEKALTAFRRHPKFTGFDISIPFIYPGSIYAIRRYLKVNEYSIVLHGISFKFGDRSRSVFGINEHNKIIWEILAV